MSTILESFLFGQDDVLDEEMRPERIFGAQLAGISIRVRVAGKAPAAPGSQGSAFAPCGKADLISSTSGVMGPAELRSFLRWLADSVDNDMPSLDLQVSGAEGDAQWVQNASRRLAGQAFG